MSNLGHKLHLAIEHLALGPGNLSKKLLNVFISHLISLRLDSERSETEAILEEATKLATSRTDPTGGKLGNLQYTLETNHWSANKKIATLIFRAYEIELGILE